MSAPEAALAALDFAALADGLLLSQSTGDGTAAEVEAAALEGTTLDYDQMEDQQSSTSSESPPSAHRRTDLVDGYGWLGMYIMIIMTHIIQNEYIYIYIWYLYYTIPSLQKNMCGLDYLT